MRWAKHHIYSWLILSPIVLGLAYASAARLAEVVTVQTLAQPLLFAIAFLFEVCLIALSLSRATAEVFHLRRPESQFEALPLSTDTYFHYALLLRLLHVSLVAVGVWVVTSRLGAQSGSSIRSLIPFIAFVLLTALAQVLAALNWIHWNHKRERAAASGAVVVILGAASLAALMLCEAISFRPAISDILRWPAVCVSLVALYFLARVSHRRWRATDLEYARRLERRGRRTSAMVTAVTRRFGALVQAQVARDLLLTLRGFSSAVYVAVAFAALSAAALVFLLTTDLLPHSTLGVGFLDATWLPSVVAIKVACVLAIVSLAALVPVLLGHQAPHFWLERSTGVTGLDMWQAKLWYSRLVTLPAPLLVWTAGILSGKAPLFYSLPLLAECLWLWWMVGSIVGALSFEMPARVVLGVTTVVMVGLTAGVLTAMAWPVGLLIYVQAMHALTKRGRERARYFLIVGDD
jgi:hypothetical protein